MGADPAVSRNAKTVANLIIDTGPEPIRFEDRLHNTEGAHSELSWPYFRFGLRRVGFYVFGCCEMLCGFFGSCALLFGGNCAFLCDVIKWRFRSGLWWFGIELVRKTWGVLKGFF